MTGVQTCALPISKHCLVRCYFLFINSIISVKMLKFLNFEEIFKVFSLKNLTILFKLSNPLTLNSFLVPCSSLLLIFILPKPK